MQRQANILAHEQQRFCCKSSASSIASHLHHRDRAKNSAFSSTSSVSLIICDHHRTLRLAASVAAKLSDIKSGDMLRRVGGAGDCPDLQDSFADYSGLGFRDLFQRVQWSTGAGANWCRSRGSTRTGYRLSRCLSLQPEAARQPTPANSPPGDGKSWRQQASVTASSRCVSTMGRLTGFTMCIAEHRL